MTERYGKRQERQEEPERELEGEKLRCVDCLEEFVFEPGEQAFFASHGYTPPIRCPYCRKERRKQRKKAEERRVANGSG